MNWLLICAGFIANRSGADRSRAQSEAWTDSRSSTIYWRRGEGALSSALYSPQEVELPCFQTPTIPKYITEGTKPVSTMHIGKKCLFLWDQPERDSNQAGTTVPLATNRGTSQ